MTINEHATEFAGLAIQDFESESDVDPARAWRVAVETHDGDDWGEAFENFCATPSAKDVRALIVGPWGEPSDSSATIVEAIVASADRLPKLEAIFLGDIIVDECEMSWIEQSDVSPILSAFPGLLEFRVRGGNSLSLGSLRHGSLRKLVVESGGLGADVVRQVAGADLPQLEHVELWLGDDGYGASWSVNDLGPILRGDVFPKLKTLALRNASDADDVAKAVASAPILERVDVLDLSLGALGDDGAAALLASPLVKRLKRLDLHHHFCSADTTAKLSALGIEVDVSSAHEPDDDYRYIAVSE